MRLLLVNPNRAREPFPVPPLGLACVAASVRRAGHGVHLADLALGDWRKRLTSALAAFRPDAVGLGVRNVDNTLAHHFESYLPGLARVARRIRSTGLPLILGGAGFSIFPRGLLDLLGADMGIVGEGEQSLPLLLEHVETGRDLDSVPGLLWRKDGLVNVNPQGSLVDLGYNPLPAHDLIDYRAYELEAGFAAVQTKRGCPNACIHCTYPLLEGHGVRLRDPTGVADELKLLSSRGVRHVFFADGVFNLPRNGHVEGVCDEILRRGLDIRWMAYVNPVGLTVDAARLMKRAGCIGVELGADSGSDRMLQALGKGFTAAEVMSASRTLTKANIPQAIYLLIGGPGEDGGTIRKGLDAIARHTRPRLVAINVGLRVLPGTRLAGLAEARDPDLLAPNFYLSPGVDRVAMSTLHDLCAAHWRFATPRDYAHPLTRLLLAAMVRLRVRPWWRHGWLGGLARLLTRR